MRAEMSQHSQRTQQGPSVGSILAGGVLVLAAAGVSTWIISSPALTWREVAGSVCASALACLLTGQVVERIVSRRIVIDRAEREAARIKSERERNTATWEGDAGEKLTIRYEPLTGRYYAEGWISDHWQIHPETEWKDRETLASTLTEIELSGEMVPWDDEGTRGVRARLDLPGWDVDEMVASVTQPAGEPNPDREAEDEVNTTWPEDPRTEVLEAIRTDLGADEHGNPDNGWAAGWAGGGAPREPYDPAATVVSLPVPVRPGLAEEDDRTRRLDRPEFSGPSAAALRAIEVPVFRTEADRAAWAAERDIPTEFLPVQDGRHRPACDVDGATGWCTTHGQYEG